MGKGGAWCVAEGDWRLNEALWPRAGELPRNHLGEHTRTTADKIPTLKVDPGFHSAR